MYFRSFMKYAKIAVFGQLGIAVVLLGVFALKSSSAEGGGAHGKAAAAAHAPAHAAGDAGAPGGEPGAAVHGEVRDEEPTILALDDSAARARLQAGAPAGHGAAKPASAHGPADSGHSPAAGLAGDPKTIARALLEGNTRFLSGHSAHPDLEQQRETSAQGQHPGAMILGCADSRVPPELVFDRGIGELFVVRSAGNIAEPVAIGSLEYAFEHLHAKVLLVMGHEKCGAVQAALSEQKMPTPNLEALVERIAPAVKGLKAWAEGDDLIHMAVEANVRRQADELLRQSPLLRQAVAKGEITILKAVYDIETGRVRPI
jgi:carbonic anhydrase